MGLPQLNPSFLKLSFWNVHVLLNSAMAPDIMEAEGSNKIIWWAENAKLILLAASETHNASLHSAINRNINLILFLKLALKWQPCGLIEKMGRKWILQLITCHSKNFHFTTGKNYPTKEWPICQKGGSN